MKWPPTGPAHRRTPTNLNEHGQNGIHIAGQYQVTHTERPIGRTRLLSVNPVTGQSDLTPADAADIARVFGDKRVQRIPFGALAGNYIRSTEVSAWLMPLVLGALTAEALAGAWFVRRRKGAQP
jgi:hypothetical protein